MFAYGFLAVVLVLYLEAIGFNGAEVGLLLGLTLLGDAAISLLLTTRADRFGRRRTLFLGSLLMVGAGIVFAGSTAFPVLLVAATLGVLSPSGNEVGPFLAIEQASLSQLVDARRRTSLFARYQVVGSVATACGSLAAGVVTQAALDAGFVPVDSFRVVIIGYAVVGVAMAFVFPLLSRAVEVPATAAVPDVAAPATRLGLHRSRGIVARLSALFALDAFGGGFVMQGFIAFWLTAQFGADPAQVGAILFAANLLAAVSALAAGPLAARFGLIRTMVFTHLPSNVLLILVPFMPTLELAVALLLDPVQHQPDGRADPAVVHDRRRRPRRALRGRRGHRDRPEPGRRRLAADRRAALPRHGLRRGPVRHRRQHQDRVRPAPVSGVQQRAAARGAPAREPLSSEYHLQVAERGIDRSAIVRDDWRVLASEQIGHPGGSTMPQPSRSTSSAAESPRRARLRIRRLERRLAAVRELEAKRDRQLARARDRGYAHKEAKRLRQLEKAGRQRAALQSELVTLGASAEPGQAGGVAPDVVVRAYCLREKRTVEVLDPTPIVMRNGRSGMSGTCASCGSRVTRPR